MVLSSHSQQAIAATAPENNGSQAVKGVDDDYSVDESAEDSSTNERSTTESHKTGTSDDDAQAIKDALAKHESKRVFHLRLLVIFILLAAALSISVTVYYITSTAENEQFETQFESVAHKIIGSFEGIMTDMSAISGLALMATQSALDQVKHNKDVPGAENATSASPWPFVTIGGFQEQAVNARVIAGAIYVSINPIVGSDEIDAWEEYTLSEANSWIQEGMDYQNTMGLNGFWDPVLVNETWLTDNIVDPLHTFDKSGKPKLSTGEGPYLPRWETSPVLPTSMVNENLFEKPHVNELVKRCIETKSAILGGFHTAPPGSTSDPNPTTAFFANLKSMWEGRKVEYEGDPMSHLVMPIFDTLHGDNRRVVGVLKSTIHWRWFLSSIVVPGTEHGIRVVLENECDGTFTYQLDGEDAHVIGFGDQHDPALAHLRVSGEFQTQVLVDGTVDGIPFNQEDCPYSFHVYATTEDLEHHMTKDPIIISVSVFAVFLFAIFVFFAYDYVVEKRQRFVLAKATQSSAIVSSLFPKQVRDRLMAIEGEKVTNETKFVAKNKLGSFLNGETIVQDDSGDQPIADFFPNCTIFMADIAGFTAWSSTREPAQVFVLLQTVYQNFDILCKKRRVFKVETIGDCYLAVTGLPEPQNDHATRMAKFAWDCLIQFGQITKSLEVSLGPDTGDLGMRFGLHSGPVTAGVLKGDRARFQLFGDTINTAARMESTGVKGRIQCSESTATILRDAGKEAWLKKREDAVNAKGKGLLNTYWIVMKRGAGLSSVGSSHEGEEQHQVLGLGPKAKHHNSPRLDKLKETRLVDWISDLLLEHVKKVVAATKCRGEPEVQGDLIYHPPTGKICLDEVVETIRMPTFNAHVASAALVSKNVEVPPQINSLLREYVSLIARSYRSNHFHSFEHACHVVMSVNKLLSRVVAPDLMVQDLEDGLKKGRDQVAEEIHAFTHGLTSDPLAVFAIVFSALIHDVDHQGVSNAQLIKEEPGMGELYRNKSVAEQNSVDVAWDLLMTEQFMPLRKFIFKTRTELMRFRQLIVNVVLATDIFDKELGQLRKDRWERAFHGDGTISPALVNDMRATIVMEHIIQASDVSHTMQHWHVYHKWNRKLFQEMYTAYKAGRMAVDPREFWYQGELLFFDNYIIPLAKKLKECNVFGVSSDEYLGYAQANRREWSERGEELLRSMIEECESFLSTDSTRSDSTTSTSSSSGDNL